MSDRTATTQPQTHCDGGNVPIWLFIQAKPRGTLVNDGKRTDSSSGKEEEWGGVDSPWYRILANVDNKLNEQEDCISETSGDDRSHPQACKNSSKAFAVVPAPLNFSGTSSCNTNASDR